MRRRVLLGITGGIAAYKSAMIASALTQAGVDVVVVMTDAATRFITPLTLETLSKNRVITDMFTRDFPYEVKHVSLAQSSDLVLIAPASADFIAKAANGLADDMLSTTYLACKGIKVMCPAMNTGMYNDTATQDNLLALRKRGVHIIEPTAGRLACGDCGKGRMEEPQKIVEQVLQLLNVKPDCLGRRVLVTAGATVEDIDGVRFISNYSSGKMGLALAMAAQQRGAKVSMICGNMSVSVPDYIPVQKVKSTKDMYQAVLSQVEAQDVVIMAAAPADYGVEEKFDNKIKAASLTLHLVKNPDIAQAVGANKGDTKLVVFAAETQNLLDNARAKLISKHADMVVANDVTQEGAGFGVDTNIATLITPTEEEALPQMSKEALADVILDKILTL